MWSMSKSYGMAGWRIGFVVGNAEIVERINLLSDHTRVGMLAALQQAAAVALEGPEDEVEERRADLRASPRPGRRRLFPSRRSAKGASTSGSSSPRD